MPKKIITSEQLNSIENIKEALIKACIKSRPSYFKPYLFSEKVITSVPDKEAFYKFFRRMLSLAKKHQIVNYV